jgi:Tol biopolymer transport system component
VEAGFVRPGERVGHYEILSFIARGGMGVVFRARDTKLERDVALKCPSSRHAESPDARERFVREARAAAGLSHPNVVPVHEIFEWEGRLWVAMELVDGVSLASLLRGGKPLGLREILRCALGVSAALVAAHEKRILHRDVNPNNILVRPDGWPRLTDFGLAHLLITAAPSASASTITGPLTMPGQLLGTRGYMSPESILGKPVDERSDLFSLGAVIYEMCTGRRAFEAGAPGAEFDAILHRSPEPVSTVNPGIPAELERVVSRALAKDPSERYPTAKQLHDDLAALRRQLSFADFASTTPPRSAPRLRRPSNRAIGAGAVIVLLLALVVAGTAWRSSPRGGILTGTPRQLTSDPGWESEPALSPDGNYVAFTSNAGGNPDIWLIDSQGGSRLRLTDDPANDHSPTWFPDGSAIAFVSDRGGAPGVWRVPSLGGPALLVLRDADGPAISPDGQSIAFTRTDERGRPRIVVSPFERPEDAEWRSGEETGPFGHRDVAFSPDGRSLCYSDQRDLWLSAASESPRRLTHERGGDFEPVFARDGRSVIFASYRGDTLALWRIATAGGNAERLTVGTGPESQPALSSDGLRLAYSTFIDAYDLVIVDLETGERETVDSLLDETGPSLAGDGSAIVYVSGRAGAGDLWHQALAGGRRSGSPRRLTNLSGNLSTPALSPDGRWVAFKREAGGAREIWIVSSSGGPPERFSEAGADSLNPSWSPDGARLAYVREERGDYHVWTAPVSEGRRAGDPLRISSGHGMNFLPVWSWDGRWIAWTAGDGSVRLAAPSGNESPRVLLDKAENLGGLRWNRKTGELWAAAALARGTMRYYRLSPAGGAPFELDVPALARDPPPLGDFDLSADGRWFAYTRQETRGDLWLLDAVEGEF